MNEDSKIPVSNPVLIIISPLSVFPIEFTQENRDENIVETSDYTVINSQYNITELPCGFICACSCLVGICGLTIYGPFCC